MVGDRIRRARRERGWTQQRLAKEAGVSRRHLIALEQEANVSLDVLRRIAAALDLEEIELGELTLVRRAARPVSRPGRVADRGSEPPWSPRPPIREERTRSVFPVAASVSRGRRPATPEETASIPNTVIEIDEILVRVLDQSFEAAGLFAGDLLVVQLRPSGDAATGELAVVTVGGRIDIGRWWEKHGRRRLLYDSRRARDLSRLREVVVRGVVTYRIDQR